MTIRSGAGLIRLPDNRGCVLADLWAAYPGQVRGRVLDASGTAVPNLTVELISADTWDYAGFRLRGVTDASGRYAMSGVQPGSYVVAVAVGYSESQPEAEPRYLFAGGTTTKNDARRVEVAGGARRAAGDLILSKPVRVAQLVASLFMRTAGRQHESKSARRPLSTAHTSHGRRSGQTRAEPFHSRS